MRTCRRPPSAPLAHAAVVAVPAASGWAHAKRGFRCRARPCPYVEHQATGDAPIMVPTTIHPLLPPRAFVHSARPLPSPPPPPPPRPVTTTAMPCASLGAPSCGVDVVTRGARLAGSQVAGRAGFAAGHLALQGVGSGRGAALQRWRGGLGERQGALFECAVHLAGACRSAAYQATTGVKVRNSCQPLRHRTLRQDTALAA